MSYMCARLMFVVMMVSTVAAADYDPYQRDTPSDVVAQLQLASRDMELGNYGSAKDRISIILLKRPQYFLARYQLGLVYDAIGRTDLAMEELEKASRLNYEMSLGESTIYNSLGFIYQKVGRSQQALEQLMVALKYENFSIVSNRDREKIMNNMGITYASMRATCESDLYYKVAKKFSGTGITAEPRASVLGLWRLEEWLEGGSRRNDVVVAGMLLIQTTARSGAYMGEFQLCVKTKSRGIQAVTEKFRISYRDGTYRFAGKVVEGTEFFVDDNISAKLGDLVLEGQAPASIRSVRSVLGRQELKVRFAKIL